MQKYKDEVWIISYAEEIFKAKIIEKNFTKYKVRDLYDNTNLWIEKDRVFKSKEEAVKALNFRESLIGDFSVQIVAVTIITMLCIWIVGITNNMLPVEVQKYSDIICLIPTILFIIIKIIFKIRILCSKI